MFKTPDEQYFGFTRVLPVCGCLFYGLVRFAGIMMTGGDYVFALRVNILCWLAAALMILIMYVLRENEDLLALLVPLLIFICFTAGALYLRDLQYYFLTCLGISGLACLYQNYQRMIQLYFAVNGSIMVMLLGGLFAGDPRMDTATATTHWIISLLPSAFILALTHSTTAKAGEAGRAFNTFTKLMKTTSNLIVLVDAQNRVTYISKSLAKFANIADQESATGRPVYALFNDADMQRLIGEALSAEGFHDESKEVVLEGEQRYFHVVADNFGEAEGKFIDIAEITSVVKAKMEAEEASKAKTDFLAVVSHEIRTPLNAIIGLAEAGLRGKRPELLRSDLETIRQAGTGLLSIVNDTLDISKINAGGFALVPVEYDIAALVNETAQMNLVRVGQKQFRFKLDLDRTLPERLFGDEIRVRQILNNLLSNAIKYTPAGGVTLAARWTPVSAETGIQARLSFVVSDTGIGIRREDLAKLFNEYIQVDTTVNRNIEGTGLGLAITKQLTEMMGGIISVESEYGKGSVFTVEIQQGIARAEPIGVETAERIMAQCAYDGALAATPVFANLRGKKILVVDDVAANLDVAIELLTPCGVGVYCASRAREALEMVRAGAPRYDAVLMDYRMPEINGIEAARLIRGLGTEYAAALPIIALTADDARENGQKFLENGFDGVAAKPINLRQLDLEMRRCVQRRLLTETPPPAFRSPPPETEVETGAGAAAVGSAGAAGATGATGGEEALAPEASRVPGLNWQEGRRRYGEIPFQNILHSFARHTPETLRRMETMLPENWPDYSVAVHGLKSSCYGICADGLGERAALLEKLSREGYSAHLQTAHERFAVELEELLRGLQDVLYRRRALERKNGPARETLLLMLDGSRHFRVNQMEEALEELEKYSYEEAGADELVAWLREQTDNLAYGAVARKLEDWLREEDEAEAEAEETGAAVGV
ncbi:MAG: response regulator [Gracilibacteraceae bacterium]|nr:response regulator [Gracilibacteraceae bacterium]